MVCYLEVLPALLLDGLDLSDDEEEEEADGDRFGAHHHKHKRSKVAVQAHNVVFGQHKASCKTLLDHQDKLPYFNFNEIIMHNKHN